MTIPFILVLYVSLQIDACCTSGGRNEKPEQVLKGDLFFPTKLPLTENNDIKKGRTGFLCRTLNDVVKN
jgi:hypothetical protein